MIVNLIYLDIGIDLFLANRTCVTCLNIHISACVFCVCIIHRMWLFCTYLEIYNCVLRRQNKRISKNAFNEDLLCINDMSTNFKPLEMTKMASFDIIQYYLYSNSYQKSVVRYNKRVDYIYWYTCSWITLNYKYTMMGYEILKHPVMTGPNLNSSLYYPFHNWSMQ